MKNDLWRLSIVACLASFAAVFVVAAAMFAPKGGTSTNVDLAEGLVILGQTFATGIAAGVVAHLVALPVMYLTYFALRKPDRDMQSAGPLISASWTAAAWFITMTFVGWDEITYIAPQGLVLLTIAASILTALLGARIVFRGK
ncbi:MAG: hypothetical protein AAF367_01760 [Pseudomonadota bacterium]